MLRIDANVEETQAQVELGHTELLKYFKVGHTFSINGINIIGGVTRIAQQYIIFFTSNTFLICRV